LEGSAPDERGFVVRQFAFKASKREADASLILLDFA
jgi:hypothetical protein